MPKVYSGERLKARRNSYNYRAEYFKRNPGLFGHIWFCSQCGKPLFGRENVYIDHIIPLSQGGPNKVSNCTAICRSCNLSKSDKIDGRIVKGYIFKFFESNIFRADRGIMAVLALIVGIVVGGISRIGHGIMCMGNGAFRAILLSAGKIIKKGVLIVTTPIRKGSIVSRLFFLLLMVAGVVWVLLEYTSLLDAWL